MSWHVRQVPIATEALQQIAFLFDHLVGAGKQRWRNGEAERPRGFEIDNQIEFGWLLDRKIAGFRPVQNLVNITGGAPE